MNEEYGPQTLKSIIEKLKGSSNGNELSYIEVKDSNIDPDLIGKSISAIANTCRNEDMEEGYMIFGLSDRDLSKIGVSFDPFNLKAVERQDMEIWLRQMVLGVDFRFVPFKLDNLDFLIIKIGKALGRIATFKKTAYIRIGKNTSALSKYPDIEKKIWSKLDKVTFWRMSAKSNVKPEDVLDLLDHECYFRLVKLPNPSEQKGVIDRFEQEKFILKEGGDYMITNLGALVLGVDMRNFPTLQYKTPRIITYQGDDKLSTVIKDKEIDKGYAAGFEDLVSWIGSQIPEPQHITKTFREQRKVYPEKALRELIANALIHQDCEEEGMRPLIEIYKNHIDISNPGSCLVKLERILGAIPKARNEILVDVMKRLYICETRGSGIPRTVGAIEIDQLPAPSFINQENGFKVSLYSHKSFDSLNIEERLRACFQHTSLMYIVGSYANNETLRKRFGIGEKKANVISKLVRLAKDQKLIKDFDPKSKSKKFIKYVPFWA